jgi:hypothetical protein
MRFEFQLTRDEWADASNLHRRRDPNARSNWGRPIQLACTASAVLGLFLLAKRVDGGGWLAPAALIAVGLFVPIRLILAAHAEQARVWQQIEPLLVPTAWDVDADGVRTTAPAWEIAYAWAAFTRWAEGHRLFLLYQTPDQFRVIPKRAFASEQDIADFRQLLAANIPGADLREADRAVGFPVLPPKTR